MNLPTTSRWSVNVFEVFVAFVLILCLALARLFTYLLFHSIVETLTIVVFLAVFVIAWNARQYLESDFLLFLGVSYLFIAGVDGLHTLAFQGMGVFTGADANLPTSLWVAARYMQAFALLLAPCWVNRRMNLGAAFASWGIVAVALCTLVFLGRFPICYSAEGLTPFKKISEYLIITVMALGMIRLTRARSKFDPLIYRLIMLSIGLTIVSEFMFTLYFAVTDIFNLLGHLGKLAAVYFLYKALVESGLKRPFALLFRDLKLKEEELRASQALLEIQATYDSSTGLPNRRLFGDRLEQAIERQRRHSHDQIKHSVGVILMDLDDFKRINDTRGHSAGDLALKTVADRLQALVRKSDTVCRYGGDEFAFIMEDLDGETDVDRICKKILNEVEFPFELGGKTESIHVSLGVSFFPEQAKDVEALLRYADLAMYTAKKIGNTYRIYSESDPEIQELARKMGILDN